MNEKVLRILEFDKLTHILAEFAGSEPAKKICLSLRPSSNIEWIAHAQEETSAALSRLMRNDRLSFGANIDVRPFIKAVSIGKTLSAGDLLAIARLLTAVAEVRRYHENALQTSAHEDGKPIDCLDEYFNLLDPLDFLTDDINRCIISEEEISDDASPALREIRRNISSTSARIQSQLSKMVNNHPRREILYSG